MSEVGEAGSESSLTDDGTTSGESTEGSEGIGGADVTAVKVCFARYSFAFVSDVSRFEARLLEGLPRGTRVYGRRLIDLDAVEAADDNAERAGITGDPVSRDDVVFEVAMRFPPGQTTVKRDTMSMLLLQSPLAAALEVYLPHPWERDAGFLARALHHIKRDGADESEVFGDGRGLLREG